MQTVTVLETPRLRLRQVVADDFEALFSSVFEDELVMRHLSGSALAREKALSVFNEVFDHEGSGRKPGVLELRETKEFLGYAGLMACSALGEEDYEIGFVLKRDAWRKGYGTEIGLAQLNYGYQTTGNARLLAQVRPANAASRRTLRRIGMEFVKEYERPGRGLWQVFKHTR
jgi:ribosomal-protein-alanine N-acetyltransferase